MSTSAPCTLEGVNDIFKALSNEHRLRIMGWLMNPVGEFPDQVEGDPVADGVCVAALTRKTGLTQPSVTNHLHILQQAGLVRSRRVKNWVYYRPNPARFHEAIEALEELASRAPDRANAA